MADQQVYDSDADQEHNPALSDAEANPAGSTDSDGAAGDTANNETEQPLGDREAAAADSTASGAEKGGGADKKEDDKVGKGYTGKVAAAKKKGKGLAGKLKNSKKVAVIGAAGAGAGMIAAVIFLLLLASSLKLPNITENIVGYEFASVARTFSNTGEKITDETLAKRATQALKNTKFGQATYEKAKAIQDKIDNLHDRATGLKEGAKGAVKSIPGVAQFLLLNDKYNPAQVEKNLQGYGITFSQDTRGRPVVTISGSAAKDLGIAEQSFITQPPTGLGRFIPGYNKFLKASSHQELWNDNTLRQALKNAYVNSARLNSVPRIIRGLTGNRILKRIRMNRAALAVANFLKARDAKKQAQILDEEIKQATAPSEPLVPDSGPSGDAAQQASETQTAAEEKAAADTNGDATEELRKDSTGIDDQAAEKLAKAASHGTVSDITHFMAGPLFSAMYLACVFDEGAVPTDNSAIIDGNNDSNERSFMEFAAISNQLQRGPESNAQITEFDNAIAAMSDKVGSDEAYSVPLLRARGSSYDTSTEPAAQSTAYGFQTPQDSINNSFFWSFMTSVRPYCGTISSAYTAGIVALGDIAVTLLTIPTGGEGAEANAGAEAASQSALKVIMGRISKTIVSKFSENFGKKAGVRLAAKNAVTKGYKLFKTIVKNGVVVVGTESLGTMMAASHNVGLNHTGHETGNTYINQIDAGGNSVAQEQMRTMMFGRPLLKSEVCQSNVLDLTYEKDSMAGQSAYQRYLATTNPRSLLARTAISVHDSLISSLSKPLAGLAAMISQATNPMGWLSGVFGYRAFADAAANCDSSTAYYGNIQFGWSDAENNLIDASPSYNPDENLAILADSGKAGAIAQKYAVCFGYKYAPGDNNDSDLVPDPTATVGYLLTGGESDKPLVKRDEAGNVINDDSAICSPEYLNQNSKDPLGDDNSPDSPMQHDLIMRWRLAVRYEKVQEQIIATQTQVQNT